MSSWAVHLARIGAYNFAAQPQAGAADDAHTEEAREGLRTWAADLKTVRQARSEGYPPPDVFLSHPGELKHALVSVLRKSFPSHCSTFTDAWDLAPGGSSYAEMIKACGTTRVGVVVISPDSVAKKWPMRELHILVDRHRRGEVGLVPLLWFDNFEDFKAIVRSYQQCHGKRRLWASLLNHLFKTGMVVKGVLTAQRSLPEVAEEVVAAVMRLLRQVPAAAGGGGQRPVGFEAQLKTLLEVVRGGTAVWLHGPGGQGKTRMATQLRRDLEAVRLVRRVAVLELEFTAGSGPTMSKEQALQLLKGAVHDLEGRQCDGASVRQVREWFAEAATRPATLVVVDNVHSQEQIGLLLGEPLRLEHVPFLVFTSRLLQPMGGSALAGVWTQVQNRLHHHAVAGLSAQDALQLFHDNCMRPETVPEEVEEHVVQRCGGLPLALLILAGVLTGQADTAAWMAAAQAMVEGGDPANEVAAESEFGLERIMQHSLLGLSPAAVDMFLDTACVLVGRPDGITRPVWKAWHGTRQAAAALQQLKNRNLLSSDDNGQLWVHDVLRWFGRRVVRGEVELGGCNYRGTRLWVHDGCLEPQARAGEVFNVLVAEQHTDPSLEGVQGGLGSAGGTLDFSQARFVLDSLPASNAQMSSLLACQLDCCEGSDTDIDRFLRRNSGLCVLSLDGCVQLPESLWQLSSLQLLDLSRCEELAVLPDSLGQLSSLQLLGLSGCEELAVLPESLGRLSSLQHLDLSFCKGLAVLPDSLGQLSSLQDLDLSCCERLAVLPDSLGQLSSLQYLDLLESKCVAVLPDSLGQLSSLQHLNLHGCQGLAMLPGSLGQLSTLQYLNLSWCTGLAVLPDSLAQLSCLQHLDLSVCRGLAVLPNFLGQLSSLQRLDLRDWRRLAVLPDSLGQLSSLQHLDLSGCEQLAVLPNFLGQLSSLQHLDLHGWRGLAVLPDSLGQLSSLQHLGLCGCKGLAVLPGSLGQLSTLQHLNLSWCTGLAALPDSLGQLSCLQHLDLSRCTGLAVLPDSLGQLSCLQHLDLRDCARLAVLPDSLGQLSCLKHLDLRDCARLAVLPDSLGRLSSLKLLGWPRRADSTA